MASERARGSASGVSRRTIVVGLIVLTIVGAVVAFQFLPYGDPNAIVQHWRLKIHFYDFRTGTNSTPPAYIGFAPQLWVNHTLDRFGPPGYSPISTRDDSGTIYIESNYPAIFTFGDFFNIWGQPFSSTCVWNYCAASAELVVYDRDNDNVWNTGDTAINPVSGTTPSYGAQLSLDPKIKYWDANGDNIWSPGEVVLYDTNNNNVYESGEPVIAGSAPPNSTPLKSDPLVKFVDTNINGGWNDLIPAPVMSDNGSNEGCVHRQYGLSNNKDWIIVLYASNLAGSFGCLP